MPFLGDWDETGNSYKFIGDFSKYCKSNWYLYRACKYDQVSAI